MAGTRNAELTGPEAPILQASTWGNESYSRLQDPYIFRILVQGARHIGS